MKMIGNILLFTKLQKENTHQRGRGGVNNIYFVSPETALVVGCDVMAV